MANGKKRSRCSNWSHEETMVLAALKKETFLNKKEDRLVWKQIAQKISSRFPDKKRSDKQCRWRWDTLRKLYNHIEEYCIETGQDHWQLDEDELSSMRLETAYQQDWYNIVKQVCSERKRKESVDYDPIAVKRSKRSDTGSPSAVLPESTPGRDTDTLYVTPRPALISERTLEQTHQILENISAEVRAQVKEPLQDAVQDLCDVTVEPSSKVELAGTGLEVMVPPSWIPWPECFSHGQHLGAMNKAGCNSFDLVDTSSGHESQPLSVPSLDQFWDFDPFDLANGLRNVYGRLLHNFHMGKPCGKWNKKTQNPLVVEFKVLSLRLMLLHQVITGMSQANNRPSDHDLAAYLFVQYLWLNTKLNGDGTGFLPVSRPT